MSRTFPGEIHSTVKVERMNSIRFLFHVDLKEYRIACGAMHFKLVPLSASFPYPALPPSFLSWFHIYPSIFILWHHVINAVGSKRRSVKVTKTCPVHLTKSLQWLLLLLFFLTWGLNVNRCEWQLILWCLQKYHTNVSDSYHDYYFFEVKRIPWEFLLRCLWCLLNRSTF